MMRYAFCAVVLAAGTSVAADVTVSFRDGAPTDRFTITALAPLCVEGPYQVMIDLSGSSAGLILDVTAAGAGVEVYQPLELVTGAEQVAALRTPQDGDTELMFALSELAPGAPVGFTLDLDDTMGGAEITVTGAEIAGATVTMTYADGAVTAPFGEDGTATLSLQGCHS